MDPVQYALHEAAKAGNSSRIRDLLKDGVDPNQKDKDGRTPLHYAVLSSKPKPTAAYAETGVDDISVQRSRLLQPAVSPSHTGASTLKESRGTSHRERHMKRPNSTATSRLTSQFGPFKATNSPIKDYDELFRDQAIEAVVPSRTEIDLLSSDQSIVGPKTYNKDNNGNTRTRPTAQSDSSNCVSSLLRNGTNVDLNIQDKDGQTPLHLAARLYSSNCVYSLLQNGTNVNPNIQDKDGRTPLHLAAQSNSSDCVYSLLRNGTNVNPNIQDKNRHTPLHLAAQSNSLYCVYLLLQHGTNIDTNIQDKEGHTPLQTVAFSDGEHLVPRFLEHGADPSNIMRWWQSRQGSSKKKEVPKYLKLWENAANGFDYGTVDAIVNDISVAEVHLTIGSIVWEWEVPAVFNLSDPARVAKGEAQWLDPIQQVVLVSNETSSDHMKKPTR